MEDRVRRDATTAIEAARQRLARLKFASLTASVLAFGGLSAAAAIEVSASPVTASSVPAAGPVVQPNPVVRGDDSGDDSASGYTTMTPPQANAPAPRIVSAQS
jgi:PAB1-binding protein PBP1